MLKSMGNKFKKKGFLKKVTYLLGIIGACIAYIFYKPRRKYGDYWLFGLGDDVYANNGKIFYEYIKKEHPNINLFWVCDRDSITNLAKYISRDRLVIRCSVINYLLAMDAKAAIYGFSDYDVAPGFFRIFRNHKAIVVNVSHGFDGLKGMPEDYYSSLPADIICAATKYEKYIKIEKCGADKEKVFLTGFARYDGWKENAFSRKTVKNILIMPTWRDWYETPGVKFEETPLFKNYSELLDQLEVYAEKCDLQINCVFHVRMRMFFEELGLSSLSRVKINDDSKTFQELLNDADIVITDYSSIFWDALYMKKIIILYWFDENEYRGQRGLLVDDKFYSHIVKNQKDLLDLVDCAVKGGFVQNDVNNIEFEWRDSNNCVRIYEVINEKMRIRENA